MNPSPPSRRLALKAAAAAAAAWHLPCAWAQAYPNRAITLIGPYAAGGTLDVVARWLQPHLQKALGQPVIVDVKAGASGMVGTRHVARAPADGYTLLMQTSAIVITPQVSKNPGYAPLQDFEPIALVTTLPFVLVSHPSLPARNVKELIAYAKANPGKVNYGSSGASSFGRLATEQLMRRADIAMTHVPYKGVGAIVQALYTGEVQVMLSSLTPQLSQMIESGRLNLLGVASLKPTPLVPGGEPIANTLKGFQSEVWFALFAPKGTPREAVARVQQSLAGVTASAEYRAFCESISASPAFVTGAAFADILKREHQEWGEVIKAVGITED